MIKMIAIILAVLMMIGGGQGVKKTKAGGGTGIETPAYHEPECGIGEAAYHEPAGSIGEAAEHTPAL